MLLSACLLALSYISVAPAPTVESPHVTAVPPHVQAASEQMILMVRCIKAQDWEGILRAADAVMTSLRETPKGQPFVTARFAKVVALHKLGRYAELVPEGEALLASDDARPGAPGINPRHVFTYGTQGCYFVVDACIHLGAENPAMLDKAMDYVAYFEEHYPSINERENPLAPHIRYRAADCLLKRRGHGDEAAAAADKARALAYCEFIVTTWPQHKLAAAAQQLVADANKEQP